jgi:hypothetical protein
MSLLACVNEILLLGLDDWIQAAEVASVARTVGGAATESDVQQLSIEMICDVVRAGLMKAGDVTPDGFHEWDLSPNETLDRIEHEWAALGRGPGLGEICWLCNTEEGDKRARRLADGATA